MLLNLVGVPSTNVDLKEQDFLQLIVLGEWVEPFVLPEVIRKKSILYCQNHLPSHPHFLPWVALSLPLSLSLLPSAVSLAHSAPFYFIHSTLTPNLCRTTSPFGATPWAVKQTNKQTHRANTPSLAEFHSYKGSFRARLVSCGWISLAYLAHPGWVLLWAFWVWADHLCKRQQLSGPFCGGVEFKAFGLGCAVSGWRVTIWGSAQHH